MPEMNSATYKDPENMYHRTFYDERFPFYEDLDSAPSVWVRNNKIKLPPDFKNETQFLGAVQDLAHVVYV